MFRRRLFKYVVPVILISIIINIPKFFELEIETRYYQQTYNETEEKNSTDFEVVTETYEVIMGIKLAF